jgi:hypothetical protein
MSSAMSQAEIDAFIERAQPKIRKLKQDLRDMLQLCQESASALEKSEKWIEEAKKIIKACPNCGDNNMVYDDYKILKDSFIIIIIYFFLLTQAILRNLLLNTRHEVED